LQNVVNLVEKEQRGEGKSIEELGVKDRSAVFFRAPADIKPPVKLLRKKKKEEKGGSDKDRYKGFSAKNVLPKLKTAKGRQKKLAYEYVEIYLKDIVKTPDWLKLDRAVLLTIVKSPTVNIPEVDLFEAVVRWGEKDVEDKKLSKGADSLNTVLKGILEFIRFPTMTTEDVALKVSNTKVLSPETVLQLFTYLGQPEEERVKGEVPKLLQQYPMKPRKGRKPPQWFKWDLSKRHSSLIIGDDGRSVTSSNTSYFQPVGGDIELKSGEWEWELTINSLYAHSQSLNIGVAPVSYESWASSHMIGYPGHAPGWAFACGGSQKMHNTTTSYGGRCSVGDKVKVRVNLDKKDIEFYINGVSQGVAYTDVTGPVRPAMSLYGNVSVTLDFPK